jgi:hypothetical protein
MVRFAILSAGLSLLVASAAPARAQALAQCQLCDPANQVTAAVAPAGQGNGLNLKIEADLDFGVAALGPDGAGMIAIDPRTDVRVVTGGLTDLGGLAFSGVVRLIGQPFHRVRIDLPGPEILHASGGAKAEISGFAIDVPESTMLDANGTLLFHIAGRFTVRGGEAGDFRGRVNISANYE